MKVRDIFKSVFMIILIITVAAIIGAILMIAVYMLPYNRIKSHVAEGSYSFNVEGIYPELSQGYYSAILDNDTDAVMLATAAATVNNPVIDAMRCAGEFTIQDFENDRKRVGGMLDYVNDVQKEHSFDDYPRYWHGYLLILKPLLTIMNYADVRMLNMMMVVLCMIYVSVLMASTFGKEYGLPLFLLFGVLNPVVVSLNFQNASSFYCCMISVMILINCEKYHFLNIATEAKWIFLGTGIATVFFDFLTYPAITLGVPLVIVLLTVKYDETGIKGLIPVIGRVIEYSVYWSIGYALMWFDKWVIASIILKRNVIMDGVSQVLYRTGTENRELENTTVLECWKHVLKVLNMPAYYIMAFAILIIMIYAIINHKVSVDRKRIYAFIPFVIVAIYCFIWWGATKNHCIQNSKFVYREFGIFVFAVSSGLIHCLKRGNDEKVN